ncbi:hypothetical protein [Pseudomonas sp. TH10]|uniref:hypothetical protein n=1 Tax=Pseudomonas sp. TH10 TaxID=2796376 RepID=UPI0019115858|nr:hypothetical protein [Pseudomonas sp. TH10]MBK5518430.1 hypothetical protein [Pseudomonas sp. TH10]
MNDIEWNKDDFGKELAGFLAKFFGVGELTASTPMHEIRARLELVGVMLGRSLAVCLHEGPVGADIAMTIRASEQKWKESSLRAAGTTFGPAGKVREIWSTTD